MQMFRRFDQIAYFVFHAGRVLPLLGQAWCGVDTLKMIERIPQKYTGEN